MLIAVVSCCLIAGALAVGAWRIGGLPFWVDEAIAALPAQSILRNGAPFSPFDLDYMPWQLAYGIWDPATPLYRYALALFTAVVGFSETSVRMFSLLAGLLTTIPIFRLADLAFGRRAAWLAATAFVASTTFWEFAREGRHFTFVQLFAAWTLLAVVERCQGAANARKNFWPALLICCLLTQVMGYLILPLAGLLLAAFVGPAALLDVLRWRGNVVAAAFYILLMAAFYQTLAFFHPVDCSSRSVGCHPQASYYFLNLAAFSSGFLDRLELGPPLGLSLGLPLALYGYFVGVASMLRGYSRGISTSVAMMLVACSTLVLFFFGQGMSPGLLAALYAASVYGLLRALNRGPHTLSVAAAAIVLWLLVPLLLLSLNEFKFARYAFIWSWPPLAILIGAAVDKLAGRFGDNFAGQIAAACMSLVLAGAPQLTGSPDNRAPKLTWTTARYIENRIVDLENDDWQKTRQRSQFLARYAGANDIVVTSFDDASLGYYLDRFVYGMIRGDRNDQQLLALLDEAERRSAWLWFDDTLPEFDFCLTAGDDARIIACRDKYPKFYAACSLQSPTYNQRCIPLRFGAPCRGTHRDWPDCQANSPPYVDPCQRPGVCERER